MPRSRDIAEEDVLADRIYSDFIPFHALSISALRDLCLVIVPLTPLKLQSTHLECPEEHNELFSINLCRHLRIIGSLPTVLAGEWQGCHTPCVCIGGGLEGLLQPFVVN